MRVTRIAALGAVMALGAALGAAPARAACTGDCDGDDTVAVNELIRGVNIALGNTDIDQCPVFDTGGDRMVDISELIAAVNAALNGCPIDPIFPADYRDTYAEVRDCRFSSSHNGAMIRVLANDVAAQAYLDEANPLPVGSIVVKEEYDGFDCSNDAELVRWRAMRKEEPGFDPEDGDWHWQWVEPGRSVKYDDKATCIGCHRAPECLARDYMCTEGEQPPRGTLDTVLEDLSGALLSVAGTSATDVYAVGADPGDGLGPYVLHYDGQMWERLPTGASGDLWWISVTPIDGSFYMAGEGGLILQYDLATKTFTRHQTPGTELLFGIWGTSASDLWAVGGDLAVGEGGGVVWHFDGQSWTAQDLSDVYPQGLPILNKVWGRGSDVWAVGSAEDLGVILRFDGLGWSKVDSGSAGPLFTVHGNDSIVVASGGFLDGTLLESDGGPFQDRTPASALQLNGVFVPPDGRGVAVGIQRSVAIRAAGNWQIREPGLDTIVDYHATWVDPEDGIWAVGGDLGSDPPIRGVLAHGGQPIQSTIITRCPTAGSTTEGSVSYSGQIVPLLTDMHCLNASCHSGPFVSSHYDQTTYAGMFAPGDEATSLGVCPILPGDPDHSYIVEKIGPTPRMGVQMPNTFPALSEMQMDLIRNWILEGAPNN